MIFLRVRPFILSLLRRLPAFVCAAAVLSGVAVWLTVRDPHPGLEGSLPPGCGARGDDFEVRCADGLPYLFSNGLPYPTGYDTTDHPSQSLDGRWGMRFDPGENGRDSGWEQGNWGDTSAKMVDVPSTYNAPAGPYRGHQGVVWFARRFSPELHPESGWIRLCFEGVLLRCKVWLNGEFLGDREGGYTPFYFDVKARLKPGRENVLVVRADNRLTYGSLPPRVRPRHNPVWGVYGGIYRHVYLEAIPARYMAKTRVWAYKDSGEKGGGESGFSVEVLIHGNRPAAARVDDSSVLSLALTDPAGKILPVPAAVRFPAPRDGETRVLRYRIPIGTPDPWSPGRPRLYSLRLALAEPGGKEAVGLKVGYRMLTTDSGTLRMGGRKLFLKGISKMEDDPVFGQTQTEETMTRDLTLIHAMGANYIRLAHYPHHAGELRMARDMGLMVEEEIPYFHVGEGWTQWMVDFQGLAGFPFSNFGMKQLHRKDLLFNSQRSLIEMIERDGNNPAVIMWSLGNESYSLNDRAGKVYGWLRDVAKAFDPSRPVTMAEMTYYLPLLDGRRSGARFLDVASINMYYGWYFGDAAGAADHMDRFHARYPGKSMLVSEFGAEAALGRGDGAPLRTGDRVFFPRAYSESYQAALLETHVRAAFARPFVLGVSPWCFADFYCPWFPRNPVPEYNTKGVMTRERAPKQGYFALQRLYRGLPDFRD